MTPKQLALISDLTRCRIAPWTADRANLARLTRFPADWMLSPSDESRLDALAWRYRRPLARLRGETGKGTIDDLALRQYHRSRAKRCP